MLLPPENASWPPEWRRSHRYDRLEIGGERRLDPGYASAYALRRRLVLAAAGRLCPPGGAVLDVAAGQGNFTLALAELGFRVTWNDLRADLADYVRLKHEKGDVRYLPGNLFDLDPGSGFDAVLLLEVIEHVAHPDRLLRKAAGFLKPGGRLIATTPNGDYFRSRLPTFTDIGDTAGLEGRQFGPDASDHLFLLRGAELTELAGRSGLEVTELRHFCNPLTAGHLGLSAALRVLPAGAVGLLEGLTAALPGFVRRRLSSHLLAVMRPKP